MQSFSPILPRNKQKIKKGALNSARQLSKYRSLPIEFAIEILEIGILTKEQKEILISIRDRTTTNVQASHGVGKSYILAVACLWYVFAVEGQVFTTAPSLQQVKDILWKEIRTLYDRNRKKLGGERGELFVRLSETAFCKGFTSKHFDASSWQGKHAERLLLVQDESDGISAVVDEAFEACLTGSENRGVRIGNPLNTGSPFHKACQIKNIRIPAWGHPNVSWAYEPVEVDGDKTVHRLKPAIAALICTSSRDNPVLPQSEWPSKLPRDIIPGAISINWIEKIRHKYDEFSNYWETRVEARFPTDSIEGIIPLSWLRAARNRYDSDPNYWDNQAEQDRFRIGVDVGDGKDRHAIALWRGCVLYQVKTYATLGDREDTIRLAQEIIAPLINSLGTEYAIAIDRLGVGSGTLGTLIRDGYNAVGCVFGAEAQNKIEFKDRKTELYWGLRESLRKGEIAIAPLGEIEEEVFEELAAVRYKTNAEKQIKCEEKTKTKARLTGRLSPDAGDAVIIAGEIPPQIRVSSQIISAPQEIGDNLLSEANKFF